MTIVFDSASVWTGMTDSTMVGHVVVEAGRIVEVGPGSYRGGHRSAEHIDLAGGALLPAFGDGHAHPVFGALERQGPQISTSNSVADILETVRQYAADHPRRGWIVGAGYNRTLTDDGQFDADWLDQVVADRPVVLRAHDYHTVWCNGEALRRAGITADTPDPPLGRIVRRADGSPSGTLQEAGACDLVLDLLPPPDPGSLRTAALEAGRRFAAAGVTWALDAWVDVEDGLVDAYLDVAASGDAASRFDLALRADPRLWRDQRPVFAERRRRVAGAGLDDLVRATTVKFFADGIIENGTAALLNCYHDRPDEAGMPVWTPAELREAVAAFDADQFQVHVHAIGDAGVRLALDAIEHSRRHNRVWPRRPVISHLQLVDDQDVPRFAAQGVIANFQPYWAQYDAVQTRLTIPRIGDRNPAQYQIGSMLATGAHVSFGSDWPVTSMRPMDGVRVAVTRQTATREPAGGWHPEQRLTLTQALHGYTAGAAYQASAETERGRIESGQVADLVWLSDDPFRMAPADLSDVQVLGTWLAGRRSHMSTSD